MQIMSHVAGRRAIVLLNKSDKGLAADRALIEKELPSAVIIETSVIGGRGIEELTQAIEDMVKLGVFDDIKLEKPAKTGDAEKRVLVTEYTLLVNNEAAHGVIADLYGLTSGS